MTGLLLMVAAGVLWCVLPGVAPAVGGDEPGGGTEGGVEEKAVADPDVSGVGFDLIDGTATTVGAYRGKVVLIVNTASECGLTPQYDGLERLYRAHKGEGLVVIGFPSNDFMGQEPGSNEEILAFCEARSVTFPMAAKVRVKGEGAHPLFKRMAALPAPLGGEPEWNFTKFLVDREGRVVGRFGPRTTPEDPKVVGAVERLLAGE